MTEQQLKDLGARLLRWHAGGGDAVGNYACKGKVHPDPKAIKACRESLQDFVRRYPVTSLTSTHDLSVVRELEALANDVADLQIEQLETALVWALEQGFESRPDGRDSTARLAYELVGRAFP